MTTNTTTEPRPNRSQSPDQPQSLDQPQLLLIQGDQDTQRSWALDEATRETGRRGLAKARAALRATRPQHIDVAA